MEERLLKKKTYSKHSKNLRGNHMRIEHIAMYVNDFL